MDFPFIRILGYNLFYINGSVKEVILVPPRPLESKAPVRIIEICIKKMEISKDGAQKEIRKQIIEIHKKMKYPIKFKNIDSRIEFYSELKEVHREALAYLENFDWCKKILESFVYLNLGKTLCIFLFDIENSASIKDNLLWVVVGDIPPIYLDIYGPKSTVQVLEDYVDLAEDWISQFKSRKTTKNCYPFDVKPTNEMVSLFEKRVLFMKNIMIKNIDDIPLHLM